MGVNIEADGQLFTHLNVKLAETILTENGEYTLSWILTWHLNHKLLRLPVVTCSV